MERREFIKGMAIGAVVFSIQDISWAAPGESGRKPNIVVMLSDDQGYSDMSCFGSEYIKTPNLDKLAEQGMKFTDFYAAAPICSPSRAGLMTGRIPTRSGVYSYIPADGDKEKDAPMHLPATEVTIAQLLKKQGYSTCHVGKWHLSHLSGAGSGTKEQASQPQPKDFGFDHSYGTTNNALPSHKDPTNFLMNGKPVGPLKGYSCQLVVDEGIRWIKERKDKDNPFFMYVCFHEPHVPLASPPELVERHKDFKCTEKMTDENKKKMEALMPTYFANVENMDLAAGRLLKHLDEAGLSDNTIVLFYSDNGSRQHLDNVPLRGEKADLWDGGMRVPAVIRWPGHVKAGTICREPAGGVDILPTFCEIAGIQQPKDRKIDGTSLLPLFSSGKIERKVPLFWFLYKSAPAVAIRDGDWNLVGYINKPESRLAHGITPAAMEYIKNAKLEKFELYNIREDIGQTKNLAKEKPEILEKLQKKMTDLYNEVVAEGPTWKWNG